MGHDRARLAEEFLQEAVFRSRALQAASASLFAGANAKSANCGLGAKAAVVLELSPRGEVLFAKLFERELSAPELERVRDSMRGWIERQDALDRGRNHFLKAFRTKHGFDRSAYTPEQLAEFDSGLAAINAEVDAERLRAAEQLIAGS